MRPGRLPRSLAPIINAHSGGGEREPDAEGRGARGEWRTR